MRSFARKTSEKTGIAKNWPSGTTGAYVGRVMKLSVACLARTDLTPRPAAVEVTSDLMVGPRPALDSLFDVDDDLPTTLYKPTRASRTRLRAVQG